MAKDAKGHGSEKRGAFMEKYGATGGTMASRDAQAADELARGHPKSGAVPVHSGATGPSGRDPANSSEERARIYGQRLRNDQGHTYGSPEAIKDFTSKYGGPRDTKAEQRGFNSGKREINRLRKQGK